MATSLVECLRPDEAPMGICHCDVDANNVHVADNGQIPLLDFDGADKDHSMQHVENYVWGNAFYRFSAGFSRVFERGYEAVRQLTADQKRSGARFLRGFRGLDLLADHIKARPPASGVAVSGRFEMFAARLPSDSRHLITIRGKPCISR